MLINQKYEHLREWLERMPEDFERLGEAIYDKRNNNVNSTLIDRL